MVIRVVNTVNSDQNIFLKKPFKDLNIKSVKWSINFLHLQTFLLLLMLYWCFYFLAVLGSDKWRTWDQRNRHLWRRQQHPTGEGQRLLQRGARCVINLSCFIWLDKFQIFIYKFQLFTNLQINNIKFIKSFLKLQLCLQVVNMSPGPYWWTWSLAPWTV